MLKAGIGAGEQSDITKGRRMEGHLNYSNFISREGALLDYSLMTIECSSV